MRVPFWFSSLGLCISGFYCSQSNGQEIPAGTVLEVRLRDAVSSHTAKRGNTLHAALVSPVQQEGRTVLPAGTRVDGTVEVAKSVGIGLLRERARLRLRFYFLITPGGHTLAIDSQVIEVENARESVRADGTIVGIRATESYGHQATGMVSSVAAIDPLLTLFAFAGSSSVLRFPEAEINYPAGTELHLKLLKPVNLPEMDPATVASVTSSEGQRESLSTFVGELPFRTQTQHTKASDVTNLVFLGSKEQLIAAFHLAGWTIADRRDSGTEYRTVRALAEDRGYPDGPVSLLVLDGKKPLLAFEKTLNTVEKRHHLRVWLMADQWNGQTAWTSAATHDTGIGVAKKTVIHRIDPQIDNERDKIVNDLLFSGCVDGLEMVERARVPHVTFNATGDRLRTDGRAAVLHLTNCAQQPETESAGILPSGALGNPLTRGVRQFDLTMRNAILRDNVCWQAYRGGRMIWKVAHRNPAVQSSSLSLLPTEETEEGAHLAVSESLGSYGNPTETRRTRLPELALSVSAGQFRSMALGSLFLAWQDPDTSDVAVYEYPLHIEPGVTLGMSVTLRPSHLFSQTLFFGTTQANLITGEGADAQVDRVQIRSTGYQTEWNLAPARWRLRPFVTGGATLTSYRFKNIKLSKKNGVFQFGLRRVGTIVNAFNSAQVAPMDGGKIFNPGFSYGGGFKFRISRLMEWRAEYRETYARDPDFFNAQSTNLTSQGYASSQNTASRRHGNFMLSVSFTP
jgi:hypothetical protein